MKKPQTKTLLFSVLFFTATFINNHPAFNQTITGAWRGKISNSRVELKLIKMGDSLLGTSYYYTSKNSFERYSVKGYFDPETNQVIWWDDELLNNGSGKYRGESALLSVADFNCPGEDQMLLDGSSNKKEDKNSNKHVLHFEKISEPLFNDEWDFVIENYTVGANDPYIIDSIAHLRPVEPPIRDEEILPSRPLNTAPLSPGGSSKEKVNPPLTENTIIGGTSSVSTELKFSNRKKILQTVIPVTAKTIELRFYDNAQIDGDSIALFLNNRLVFEHIFLTDKPYIVKLNSDELNDDNELVMVAENLGSIPPNTSFMVAIVGDKRYEARLYANEQSSALIRFIKQK